MKITGRTRSSYFVDTIAVSLIVVLIIFCLIFFLRPPAFGDQLDYFYHGYNILETRPTHRHLRLGLLFPIWLLGRIFGYSELSYYAIPFVSALSLSVGSFLIGRLLFNVWVGFVAGVLVVANPWVLLDITQLLPDYAAAGFLTLAFAVLIWLGQCGDLQGRPFARRTTIWLFVAGLLVGWSYLTREYVVVLFPAILLTVLALRARFFASLLPLGFGAFLIWMVELIWGWLRFDNPLVRFIAVASPRQTQREVALDPVEIVLQLPDLLTAVPGGWFFAGLFGLGLFGSAVLSLRGDRRWQIIASWLAFGWLFFTAIALLPIIVLGEDRVFLRMHKFRYWGLILPPMMVGGLGILNFVLQRTVSLFGKRYIEYNYKGLVLVITTAMSLMTLQGLLAISDSNVFVRNEGNRYVAFREFLREQQGADSVLLLNRQPHNVASSVSLPIYTVEWHGLSPVWRGEVREYDLSELPDIVKRGKGEMIAIDRSRLSFLLEKENPPLEFLEPERYGETLFLSDDRKIIVVKFKDR